MHKNTIFKFDMKYKFYYKAINVNKLSSKFEVDIAKHELSVTNVSTRIN